LEHVHCKLHMGFYIHNTTQVMDCENQVIDSVQQILHWLHILNISWVVYSAWLQSVYTGMLRVIRIKV
jgi:hypothetical protein